jgi:nitroreductase
MEFFETVAKRHSYRAGFKPLPVPRADLQKIVQAGLDAPSGKNAQTTQFIIVDDPVLVKRIAPMHAASKAFQQARAFIACIVDRTPDAVYEGMSFQVEDCAAAVENMLLAITALGYASVWIDGWLRADNRNARIGELLALPNEKIIRVILPIGIPAETYPSPAKKPFEQRAWFNGYGKSDQ